MNLNRNNYEEYFILYLDNELGEEDRRSVEEFIERNPDLKEELETLSQFKLVPDTINFPGKINLLKSESINAVNAGNYEELVLNYIDDELPIEEKSKLESFIVQSNAARKELDLYLNTKLPAETIVHPDKSSLYRHEVRRIPAWLRVAVAAILVVAAGGYFMTRMEKGNSASTEQPSADINIKPPVNTKLVKQVNNNQQENKSLAVQVKKDNPPVKTVNPAQKLIEQKTDETIATTRIRGNDLPQPEYNPNINKTKTETASIKNTLTVPEEFKTPSVVTPGVAQTLNNETGTSVEDVAFNEQGGKKSKLRGFLRKVTRTFEKTTNISATDDDDRLLIGGLAIRLK